jgi:thioredoxin 1
VFYPVGSANFAEYVLRSKGMVLVNFWSPWSEECRCMSALMTRVRDLLDEKDTIVQVDCDQQRNLVQESEVFGVPTLLIFAQGREVARYYGTMNEDELRKCVVEAKRSDRSKDVRP